MESVCIPHGETPAAGNRLFLDFVSRFDRVEQFFRRPPTLDSLEASAREIQFPDERRAALVEALRGQNRAADASVREALDKLARPGVVAVVTGQQAGYLGGPAYAVYKALTAIRLAKALERRGVEAVAVFWLATEDHDLDEIASAWIPGPDGSPLKLEAPAGAGRGGPAGRVELGPTAFEALEDAFSGLDWAAEALELARAAYGEPSTFGEAFRKLFEKVFEGRGLIQLDPLDPALRRIVRPAFRTAVAEAAGLHEALAERGAALEESGYPQQVKIPEHGTLLFTIRDGRRRPLVRDGRSFVLDGRRLNEDEVLALVEEAPETFSPNALLRPSVQDLLLPVAAYVGGPGEIAYWAQAEVVFGRVVGRMPTLFPRASFTLIDPRRARLLAKYGLTVRDCWTHRAALEERMGRFLVPDDQEQRFSRSREEIDATLGRLESSLREFDPTLAQALERSAAKIRYQIDKLRAKTAREALRRADRAADNAGELLHWIFPEKAPQERLYSFLPLWARFGPRLLDDLEEATRPECLDHQAVSL
ncbi:MAG: bacillithiol biosynthesis cysteine-adding enzyme BshC [Acidobacteria bacterium]|nr:bacillithiol biosynthesis cysteine-adding enzyme BshC [Acidobacteriota bacterium]